MTIFRLLAISKNVHLVIIKKVTNIVVEKLKQIPKNFLWHNKKLKIKQKPYAMITKMLLCKV